MKLEQSAAVPVKQPTVWLKAGVKSTEMMAEVSS
jgi:hypothetical protein